MRNFITGGNKGRYAFEKCEPYRDLILRQILDDLRKIVPGDPCPKCGEGKIEIFKGIEVGHIFMLGTKYSEAMNCKFLDEDGT